MYEKEELDYISIYFKNEYSSFKFDRVEWLGGQKTEFSQFGVEVNPEPEIQIFVGIGRLIWSSSILEEKISRCNFWLNSFLCGEIQELLGQGTNLVSRLGDLNKLLHDPKIAKLLGPDGVLWIRTIMKELRASINFRDDVVHGHHLGGWAHENIMRVPGKKFDVNSSRLVRIDANGCELHATKFLEAAALLALIDSYFDEMENG